MDRLPPICCARCLALAARDRRIRLVRLESHQGISAALNKGLDLANGEWVTFLDHDDVLEPDALFQNVRLLQENPGTRSDLLGRRQTHGSGL